MALDKTQQRSLPCTPQEYIALSHAFVDRRLSSMFVFDKVAFREVSHRPTVVMKSICCMNIRCCLRLAKERRRFNIQQVMQCVCVCTDRYRRSDVYACVQIVGCRMRQPFKRPLVPLWAIFFTASLLILRFYRSKNA